MKTLTTKIVKVNGQFDIYANENTKRFQNYADLAVEMGRNWDDMSKRSKSNFRKRHADKIKEIPTQIEVFQITATIPEIFGEYQLKQSAINHLIHPASATIFLKCKNNISGYQTNKFTIEKI